MLDLIWRYTDDEIDCRMLTEQEGDLMNVQIGDTLTRISDGKIFKLKHLGSWAGSGSNRVPLFKGLPVKLESEDGEKIEYAKVQELYGLFEV